MKEAMKNIEGDYRTESTIEKSVAVTDTLSPMKEGYGRVVCGLSNLISSSGDVMKDKVLEGPGDDALSQTSKVRTTVKVLN